MSKDSQSWRVWQMDTLSSQESGQTGAATGGFQAGGFQPSFSSSTPQTHTSTTRSAKPQFTSLQAAQAAEMKRLKRELGISKTLFELAKAEALEKGLKEGRDKGFEQGYQEGLTKAKAEQQQALQNQLKELTAPIENLAVNFTHAIDNLNEQVSYALVDMALEAAKKLAGRALEIKPEHILDDIEKLLEQNPSLTGEPILYVSIDDLQLIEAQLGETLAAAGWHLRPDVNMQRGDCRIETPEVEIDASHEDRWARLLHAVGHNEH